MARVNQCLQYSTQDTRILGKWELISKQWLKHGLGVEPQRRMQVKESIKVLVRQAYASRKGKVMSEDVPRYVPKQTYLQGKKMLIQSMLDEPVETDRLSREDEGGFCLRADVEHVSGRDPRLASMDGCREGSRPLRPCDRVDVGQWT